MTNEQKATIHNLRLQGKGYGEIAVALGLSVSTVKTYCWRHGVASSSTTPTKTAPVGHCQHCGSAILREPKKKPRKFCCDKCRETWWNRNRLAVHQESAVKVLCAHCGGSFEKAKRSSQRYCCHGCYIAARFGEVSCDGCQS